MLKHLVTRGLAPQPWARHDRSCQRPACHRSSLHSYRPLVEALEDRTLLSFIAAPTYVLSGASSVAVGDFNGDGHLDLAVANHISNVVSILLGKGDGTFQYAGGYVRDRPSSVAVGDFNGDGHLDLAVANSGDYFYGRNIPGN